MKHLTRIGLPQWGQVALAAALLFGSPSAHAGSCVRLDATRDTLAPEEQRAAALLFEEALTREGRTVDTSHCTEEWVLSHVRLGSSITVVVSSPQGRRSDRVSGVEEFPAQYSQSIRALLTRQDPRNEVAGVDRPAHLDRVADLEELRAAGGRVRAGVGDPRALRTTSRV